MAISIYLYLVLAFVFMFTTNVRSADVNLQLELQIDDNTTDRCNDLMNEFASHSSNFGLCAVTHARPIKICRKCVYQYQNVTHIFNSIHQSNNSKNQSCKEILLNADRLGILQQTFFNIEKLWIEGHCDSCFNINKTTGDYQLSNYTVEFIRLHSNAMACIHNHTPEIDTQNNTVCQDCEADYCSLNTLYSELKVIWDDAVCMDIVDSMNKTRILWSVDLQCIKRERTIDAPLLATSISVSLIPFLFYLWAKFSSNQTRNQLQAQKRLAVHVTSEDGADQGCPGTSETWVGR